MLQDYVTQQVAPLLTPGGDVSLVVGIIHGAEQQVLA